MESVESQTQASHPFHQPLGNLVQKRRDCHIPTAPTTMADGKMENQNQVSHFSTASIPLSLKPNRRRASPAACVPPRSSVVPFCSAAVENF
jgi:hypothetical protein